MPAPGTIGVILDSIMVQRLAPGLVGELSRERRVWLLDLYRPVEELVSAVRARHTAGIITRWVDGVTNHLADLGLPVVAYSGYEARSNVVCFDVHNELIGELAARHLLARGLTHFGYVGRSPPYSVQRATSFRRTVAHAGHDCAEFELGGAREQYFEVSAATVPRTFRNWLARLPKPVGIFTAFDKIAWRVAEACHAQGLRVPEDVAILGVNNDPFYCGLARPTLSSVRIPWGRLGVEAARALERSLRRRAAATRPPAPVLIDPEGIAVRESTDHIAVSDPVLARALRLLQSRASEPVAIKDIVRDTFCSRRRLEILFRTELGRSPRQELERMRMERADDLLRTTDLPIAAVAESCGYSYPERFAVAFKRTMGLTPVAFRERSRGAR